MLLLGLIYLMKSPKLLMFHYPLDYRLDREGIPVDALVELLAEPVAAACTGATFGFLPIPTQVPERADFEVCVIHKLLVARPHRPLSLFATLHRSLSPDIKNVDLLHGWEVYHPFRVDHNPRVLFLPFIVKPLEKFVLDGHRFVVRVEFSVGFSLLPWILTSVIEPPEAFKREVLTDIGQ